MDFIARMDPVRTRHVTLVNIVQKGKFRVRIVELTSNIHLGAPRRALAAPPAPTPVVGAALPAPRALRALLAIFAMVAVARRSPRSARRGPVVARRERLRAPVRSFARAVDLVRQ